MIISVTVWRRPHPKGGEAWITQMLEAVTRNLTLIRRITMKKPNQSPLAAAIESGKVGGNTNSNKEVTMSDATSGTVTMTVAELNERLATAEKAGKASKASQPSEKKLNSSSVWVCYLNREAINATKAPPQLVKILNVVTKVTAKKGDEVRFADIVDGLMDPTSGDCMHYSDKYRGLKYNKPEDVIVLRKRLVEIVNFYATRDQMDAYELTEHEVTARK
jgi:hypothetical protein